ncbi:MAG TPA: glycosyltransferase, partial [Longimicrobium sp.]|nr:glycosyltransferase [Longimicrobium sp.]
MSGLLGGLDLAAAALLLAMCAVAAWNLAAAPRLERAPAPASFPRVSLLVPARDEAGRLRWTLPHLRALDYPALEILVLDDRSRDATAAVAGAAAASDPRLRLIAGTETPPGWTGKNWACHQLAQAAAGEVLVFCDADVSPAPDAVTRTVGMMRACDVGVLTALPRHRPGTWGDAALAPLVAQLPVLALLPLPLVPRTASPALAMGNGQWLAFTRGAYRRTGGHAAVAGEVLEDVALAMLAKAAGQRLVCAAAARSLDVRMYDGLREARAGFRKNLYPLLGGTRTGLVLGITLFSLTMLYPLLAPVRHTP